MFYTLITHPVHLPDALSKNRERTLIPASNTLQSRGVRSPHIGFLPSSNHQESLHNSTPPPATVNPHRKQSHPQLTPFLLDCNQSHNKRGSAQITHTRLRIDFTHDLLILHSLYCHKSLWSLLSSQPHFTKGSTLHSQFQYLPRSQFANQFVLCFTIQIHSYLLFIESDSVLVNTSLSPLHSCSPFKSSQTKVIA